MTPLRSWLQAGMLRVGRALKGVPIMAAPAETGSPMFAFFPDRERYLQWVRATAPAADSVERDLTPDAAFFGITGVCRVCDGESTFYVDRDRSGLPLWRETLTCRSCRLSNRKRAIVEHIFAQAPESAEIYVAESDPRFVGALRKRFRSVVASEYAPTSATPRGVRREDLTALTFAAGSLDVVCASEILEHIADYRRAVTEMQRVLRPGGLLILTVPFLGDREDTLIRAIATPGAPVQFLEDPEYHEDPMSERGVLCFYHFGWDLLSLLRGRGFEDVAIVACRSPGSGHLGDCLLISARKERTDSSVDRGETEPAR